jgi:hypothetical protein
VARIEPVGSAATDRVGWVRVADVQPQSEGVVVDKVYDDPPNNTLLLSCTSSTPNVRVITESSYPKIRVDAVNTILTPIDRIYRGSVSTTVIAPIVEVETTDPNGNPGAIERLAVNLNLPPAISTLRFSGGYPSSQTELKENDTFLLVGTTNKPIDLVEIADYEAGQFRQISAAGLSFSVSVTIANRGNSAVLRPARARVRDATTGAFSAYKDTNESGSVEGVNLVCCNNLHPSVIVTDVVYPGSQQALKGAEQALVNHSVFNFNSIFYDDPIGQLFISNNTVYDPAKTVTRTSGTYNVSAYNFRISALRTANRAVTEVSTIVNIASVAAAVSVTEPATRLRSGGNDGTSPQDYLISIVSSQRLASAPSLSPDPVGSRGTFLGSWTGGPSTWTRYLRVSDTDEKGTFGWSSLVATNLAGIVTTAITGDAQYTLGGFVGRTVTWTAFQTISLDLMVPVSDLSKIQAGLWSATNQPSIRWPVGTSPPKTDGYTVQAVGSYPTKVIWLDTDAASSNTGEAYLFVFEEVA